MKRVIAFMILISFTGPAAADAYRVPDIPKFRPGSQSELAEIFGPTRINGLISTVWRFRSRLQETELGNWLSQQGSRPGEVQHRVFAERHIWSMIDHSSKPPLLYTLDAVPTAAGSEGYLSVALLAAQTDQAPVPSRYGLPQTAELVLIQEDKLQTRSSTLALFRVDRKPRGIAAGMRRAMERSGWRALAGSHSDLQSCTPDAVSCRLQYQKNGTRRWVSIVQHSANGNRPGDAHVVIVDEQAN